MHIRLIFTLSFLAIPIFSFAQSNQGKYEPQILVLSPAQATVSPLLEKEFKAQNDTIKKLVQLANNSIPAQNKQLDTQPENIKLMTKSGQAYLTQLNFTKQISYLSHNYLSYKFYERFNNELILLKDTTVSIGVLPMQQLAQKEKMDYIISFPEVQFLLNGNSKLAKITVQLYEQASNSFLINQEYIGGDENPGFEFTCDNGSLGCTINNALSIALKKTIQEIALNNPTLKRERELARAQVDALDKTLLNKQYDATVLKQVIGKDSSINMNALYQCLYNDDKTQFVAFFIETNIGKNFKALHDKTDKGKIDIITSKDLTDPGYFDSMPKTYAHIVKGVLYQNKWYYKKDHITYFDAPNLKQAQFEYLTGLIGWDYFKPNSVEYSPEFWNGNLFEKIPDRKKDPNWEKYKLMWETEERENRNYIGLNEMVAEKLKQQKQVEAEAYDEQNSAILQQFLNDQVNKKANGIVSYNHIRGEILLIYPEKKHTIISPVTITNEKGEQTLRFFAIDPQTKNIYEWTYFKPHTLKSGDYAGIPLIEILDSITKWNFSYQTLDDDNFWSKYVLLKEGNEYKYLKPLK